MLGSISIPHGRPRATTTNSQRSISAEESGLVPPTTRPPHVRSHSYLSPVDPRPHNMMTAPLEKDKDKDKDKEKRSHEPSTAHVPRIHLPGHRSRQSQDSRHSQSQMDKQQSYRRHRHTRSDMTGGIEGSRSSTNLSSTAQAITGITTMNEQLLYPGLRATAIPSLMRMASTRSNRSNRAPHETLHRHGTGDLLPSHHGRRRANSDPKSPLQPYDPMGGQQPMSEVELLLDRADRARQLAASQSITDADIARMTAELASSNIELQSRLSDSTHTASSLMRRLDDAHDSLLRTASSLVDTISSFQNLCTQSEALISNFSATSGQLEKSIQAQLARHQKSLFQERGTRIGKLEERGRLAGEKAEELGKRLDNARTAVRNWEEKQMNKRRAWKGVILGTLLGLSLILVAIMLGLGLWAWKRNSGRGVMLSELKARQALGDKVAQIVVDDGKRQSDINQKLRLDSVDVHVEGDKHDGVAIPNRTQLEQLNVPEAVKILLGDIAVRHHQPQPGSKSASSSSLLTREAESPSYNDETSPASPNAKPPRENTHSDDRRPIRLLDEL